MDYIINFLIAFLATSLGSLTGAGGGVIIKPVMDLIGSFDAASIGVLSSVTVFAMSVSSLIKQAMAKTKVDFKVAIPLAFGSLAGGNIGQQLLSLIAPSIGDSLLTSVQNFLLAVVILSVFIYMKKKDSIKSLGLSNMLMIFIAGIFLGTLSAFLGIGGGPINVAIIIFLFGYTAKESAVYSIVAIFFSQFSKLFLITVTTGFGEFDLTVLPVMVVGGVIGGIIGAKYNKQFETKTIEKAFSLLQIFIICTALINMFRGLMA